MEAPKNCQKCRILPSRCGYAESPTSEYDASRYVPGPGCPFVLLAAKDAEMEKLRDAVDQVATRLEAANKFPATWYLDDIIISVNAEKLRAALGEVDHA